jgi:aspartate racemase
MKTIGLIGGTSWESTVPYYEILNEAARDALGGLHSAKILLYSVEFAELEQKMSAGNWDACADILGDAAQRLERGGADFIVICSNTLHKLVPVLEKRVSVPFLHIADATADVLAERGIKTVGLLGTRFTMEQDFYRDRLAARGFTVLTPEGDDIRLVDEVIFHELCVGKIKDASRREYLRIIDALRARGAEAVILGCTEIGMLVHQSDTSVPLFDTTEIHARCASRRALNG